MQLISKLYKKLETMSRYSHLLWTPIGVTIEASTSEIKVMSCASKIAMKPVELEKNEEYQVWCSRGQCPGTHRTSPPALTALTSDCSVNTFIMVINDNSFLVVIWTEYSD